MWGWDGAREREEGEGVMVWGQRKGTMVQAPPSLWMGAPADPRPVVLVHVVCLAGWSALHCGNGRVRLGQRGKAVTGGPMDGKNIPLFRLFVFSDFCKKTKT